MVIWITGLPGSGKTTIAKQLLERLSSEKSTPIHLDGDELRVLFGSSIGYSLAERRKLASQYSRLCIVN